DSVPEWAADGASVGSTIEDGAYHFHFARSGIAVLAYVAVEAQRPVIPALSHALLLQKVNGKNRRVSAVSAAKRERPIFQISECRNRTASDGDDLGHPAEIGVAHSNRATGVSAPLIGL